MKPMRWSVCWVCCLLLGACSEDADRPPTEPTCSGPDCAVPPGGRAPATGGTDGAAGAPGDERLSLTGSVIQYTEDQFVQVASFAAPGTIQVLEPSGGVALGDFSGGSFVVPDVEAAPALWTLAEPASSALHFATWTLIDTRPAELTLPVVARSVMDDILNVLTVPAVPLAGTAQVVLRIVAPNGMGREGVIVAAPAAQLVVYAAAGTWSETEPTTDATGFVVLANVAASGVPGNDMQVALGGAATGQYTVRVANDALTYVWLEAP